MQGDDAERARGGLVEQAARAIELGRAKPSRLVAPGTNGVQADDVEARRAVERLGRLPVALELAPRPCEACRERVGDVVVTRNREHLRAETLQEGGSPLVLVCPASVGQVAARDYQLRLRRLDQFGEGRSDLGRLALADVEVGDVENPGGHRRPRLYTRCMAEESPEVFDDLYLGLRAGGALRKQRRGQPLTAEEQEALGRWQRLSTWRKALAIGGFAIGTFGLGFTLGGLVFGRWRKA